MDQDLKGTVLIVDDEPFVVRSVVKTMGRVGFRVFTASSGEGCLEVLEKESIDVVLMDINMSGMSGLEVLKVIKSRAYQTEVIIMTGQPTIDLALKAERQGAYDFIQKPFTEPEKVRIAIERAAEKVQLQREKERLQLQIGTRTDMESFVGRSMQMQNLYTEIRNFAFSSAPVLIRGESGSGKELVAQAIHKLSPRRDKPFVAFNAGAMNESLFASELWGHVRGAYTGATKDRVGLIEEADGGTLFIDEVADMPYSMQVSLLRFLDSRSRGKFRRLGDNEEREVNVRILAATSRDLQAAIQQNRFRDDLYNRLNAITIEIPPLRSRSEDVPSLAWYFLRQIATADQKNVTQISVEALEALQACGWREGNVRQLENAMRYAVASATGDTIQLKDLPPSVLRDRYVAPQSSASGFPYQESLTRLTYREAKKEAEVHFAHFYFSAVLKRCNGVINKAAKEVDIEAPNLRKKLKEIELDARQFRPEGSSDEDDG